MADFWEKAENTSGEEKGKCPAASEDYTLMAAHPGGAGKEAGRDNK